MPFFRHHDRSDRRRRHGARPVRRSLIADDSAATMVEFGILAMPFFLILMGIMQTGLIFFEQEMFQTAVSDAGRLIYTGQTTTSGYTQAQFVKQICTELTAVISCGNVAVDVRPYATFASAQRFVPVNSKGQYDPTLTSYSSGTSGTIVVVTGYADVPILFPIMNGYMSTGGSGYALLTASAAFRNEPWAS